MHFQRLSVPAIIAKEHQPLEVAQLQRPELLLQQLLLLSHQEASDKDQLSLPNSKKRSEKKRAATIAS